MDFISFHDMSRNTNFPLIRRPGKEKARVDPVQVTFPKGPKRKRLAKACDACHKSKRRCDGTAPCSNCSFASKECSYTDASGRPVPAPKASEPTPLHSKEIRKATQDPHPVLPVPTTNTHINPSFRLSHQDDTSTTGQKRHRSDSDIGQEIAELCWHHPVLSGRPAGIEANIIRELVHLFFAHCYPHRFIIHEPSFMAALSCNEVPQSLIFAICANAAPFSRSPRIRRSSSPRLAGLQFCREAVNLMFDASGTLICPPDLATVQALCLLEMHEVGAQYSWTKYFRYHEVAITILFETLQVHKPDPPSPTPKGFTAFIERECIRRCFWLIFVADVICTAATRNPKRFPSDNIPIQLPIDETGFEFGIQDRIPEYITQPAPKSRYASEFGHLARITSISCRQEVVVGVDDGDNILDDIIELEHRLKTWRASLPDHLQFTEENLYIHESMFEAGSGCGAYCFYFAHLADVCCALGTKARDKMCDANLPEYVQARDVFFQIMNSIGPRVKNLNWILGPILWSLSTYFGDDPEVRELDEAFESMWGYKCMEIAQTWRKHNRVAKRLTQKKPVIMSRYQRVLDPSKIYVPNISGISFMADGRIWEYDRWQKGVGPKPSGIIEMQVNAEDGEGRRDDGSGLKLPSLKAVGLLGDPSFEPRAMPSSGTQTQLPSLSISARW